MNHLPALLSLLVLTSCAATPAPVPVAPPPPVAAVAPTPAPVAAPPRTHIIVGDEVEIVDDGQLYSTINATDCLTWPSPMHKARGGQSSWHGYYPGNGDVGTVIGLSKHCDAPEIQVAILDIRGHVVAMGVTGLRFEGGGTVATGGGTGVAPATGGGGLGSFSDGLGMGTVGGGNGGRPVASAGGVFAPGDSVTVVDDGQLYSGINATDCLTWPSADIKKRGGHDSWGSFYPANGNVGTVLATSAHCAGPETIVAILDIQGYIVAIGETGLARAGATAGVGAVDFRVGDTVKISDAGQLFSAINATDCLTWPSAEIKAAGGSSSWVDYYPSNGDVGTVLGTSPHCDQQGVVVVFLSVGKHYLAIGSTGLSR